MSVYRVTGRLAYREHQPGEEFEATLPPDVEARAIARGNLEVHQISPVSLRPGSVRMAHGRTTEEASHG